MASPKTPRTHAAKPSVPPRLFNPHDRFFAFTFGQKQHAIGLLRATLPPALTARLDWDSLERRPADFVDASLRGRYSDLLFSVRMRGGNQHVLVYALVEHQSSPHPLMAYRMVRYLVRIWDEHLKAHRRARRLPLIIPVVIYHGAKPWSAARSLRDLLDAPAPLLDAAAEQVPRLRYRLIDLRGRDADALLDELLTGFGAAAIWAMENAGDDERILDGLRAMSQVLGRMMAQPDGQAALGALLRYLLATHEHIDPKKFRRAVEDALDPQAGEQVVTVYEQLIQKGRAEGRAEGRTEGRAELLLSQLEAKFGALSADARARVSKADAGTLIEWGARILTADTLADVLRPRAARKPARRSARPRG